MSPSGHRADGWDIALLVVGLAGVAVSLLAAVVAGALAVVDALQGRPGASQMAEWTAIGMTTMAIAGLPSVYFGARATFFRSGSAASRPTSRWLIAVAGFPLGLGAGYLAFDRGLLPALLAPPAQWLTALLPILIGVTLARAAGPLLPPRRAWGQLLAGAWGVPLLALFTEVIALIPILALVVLWMVTTREGQTALEALRAMEITPATPIDETLVRLLLQPWVVFPVLAYVALIVPLIEEALKSVAVWPFLGSGIGAAEAFVSGALGGAGYALFEALFLTQPGADWLAASVGRAGASLMHTFTAGLTSWGLVEGFSRRRWGRLAGAYLISVAVHGVWNASAIGIGWVTAGSEATASLISPTLSLVLRAIGIAILAALSTGALVGLARLPRRLSEREQSVPAPQPPQPPA